MSSEREWLASAGIRPRKRLGQNFLLDPRIPELIATRASWDPSTPLLEIGPGGGALTHALLAHGHPVLCVEKDPALVAVLRRRFAAEIASGWLVVREGDALELDSSVIDDLMRMAASARVTPAPGVEDARTMPVAPAPGVKPWVAGNLPYTITTPLLLWCYRNASRLGGAVVMVQREYGDRLLAEVGTRDYSSMTVWTRAHAVVKSLIRVGRSSFWPRPGVESIVIELRFPDPPPFAGDRALLEKVLRAAFSQRRKMLQNTIATGLNIDKSDAIALLQEAGCDPMARAETLELEQYARLVTVWSDDPRSR